MDLELKGKVAVITGGSRGIGRAIAEELASEGADVVIVARTKEPAEDAAAEIAEKTGARVIVSLADTGVDTAVREMADDVVNRLGRIDILVNCAAHHDQMPAQKNRFVKTLQTESTITILYAATFGMRVDASVCIVTRKKGLKQDFKIQREGPMF